MSKNDEQRRSPNFGQDVFLPSEHPDDVELERLFTILRERMTPTIDNSGEIPGILSPFAGPLPQSRKLANSLNKLRSIAPSVGAVATNIGHIPSAELQHRAQRDIGTDARLANIGGETTPSRSIYMRPDLSPESTTTILGHELSHAKDFKDDSMLSSEKRAMDIETLLTRYFQLLEGKRLRSIKK